MQHVHYYEVPSIGGLLHCDVMYIKHKKNILNNRTSLNSTIDRKYATSEYHSWQRGISLLPIMEIVIPQLSHPAIVPSIPSYNCNNGNSNNS